MTVVRLLSFLSVALAVLLAGSLAARAEVALPVGLPQTIALPVQVHIASRVLNISRMEEVRGEMSAQIEYTVRWRDPTQRFDPIVIGSYRVDSYGPEAQARLAKIWNPGVGIANQIGEARSQTLALSIQSDGSIALIRQIEADFRVAIDLSAFPFDRQRLDLVFTTPRHAADEVIFSIDDRDRELSSIAGSLATADWQPETIGYRLTRFYGWNAKPFSKATATATVSRQWPRYLLRIFIPFAAIVSASLYILWAPDRMKVDKGGIIYSALLALAALSFSFESSFPGSMSVNSPIAFMISIGYFYLVLTLLTHLVLIYSDLPARLGNPFLSLEIRRNLRFSLPAVFALICICAAIRSIG